jgi:hypothetical protein
MSNLVTLLTDPAVGGTFISWSIEYLTGHDQMYSVKSRKYVPLIDNPNMKRNAHGYRPNQFDSSADVINAVQTLESLPNTPNKKLDLIYLHQFYYHLDKHKDWYKALDAVFNAECPIITVRLLKPYILYHGLYTKRASSSIERMVRNENNETFSKDDTLRTDGNNKETFSVNIKYYFSNTKHPWNHSSLTTVYDKRELMALNFRPFDTSENDAMFDTRPRSKTLNLVSVDIWMNMDNTIHDIMNFLNISIDQERYNKWIPIYNEWKKLHTKRVMWCWYYDQIIDYIINGYEMDLQRFDLDIYQEATIQHTMIYKHGLNFKTYKLDKFTNTKQLHDLLEPNTHPITNYEYS